MTKLTMSMRFPTAVKRTETQLEKTIRASKAITDGETEKREEKTARLRRSRLERG